MNIFLTGGTGFIGSHFLKHAIVEGHSVRALRRRATSKTRIPIDQQPEWLDHQLDEVAVEEIQGFDVLVHLAAHTANMPYDNLANCLRWNLLAVLNLFEQARLAGIKRFIVAGSCFEYGRSGERYTAIPTDAFLDPTNSYAASKASASIALKQWADQHNLSLEILRIFHVYGEGEPSTRLWPSLRRAALAGEDFPMTKGEQIRDFMHVSNVAKAFLQRATAQKYLQCPKIFNMSSGNPISIKDFAEYWWAEFCASGKLLFGACDYRTNEVMRYVPSADMIYVGSKLPI